jgi:hypothetical protein
MGASGMVWDLMSLVIPAVNQKGTEVERNSVDNDESNLSNDLLLDHRLHMTASKASSCSAIAERSAATNGSLFKYCAPTPRSLENLRGKRLCYRHFGEFNDPFEFRAKILSGVPSRDREPERFAAAAAAWGFPEGVPMDMLGDATEYFESLEDGQPPFSSMFRDIRISCFASEGTDLLMWSHYADGLRGFCLEFNEEALQTSDPSAYVTAVEYLEAPPTVDSFVYAVADDQYDYHMMAIDEGDGLEKATGRKDAFRPAYVEAADAAMSTMHAIWRNVFASKPSEWKYEREKRLLLLAGAAETGPILKAYPESAVSRIILGERMEPSYRKDLVDVLASSFKKRPPIFVAVRREDTYEIAIEASD